MWLGKCAMYRLDVAETNMHFLATLPTGTATSTLSGFTGIKMESTVAFSWESVLVGRQECRAGLNGMTSARWLIPSVTKQSTSAYISPEHSCTM